jgi:hypothetical protein
MAPYPSPERPHVPRESSETSIPVCPSGRVLTRAIYTTCGPLPRICVYMA